MRRWRRKGPWRRCRPRCRRSCGATYEEDWVVVRERPTERNAISRERSVEAIIHLLHLHIISEHPLSGITVIHSGGQERLQHLIAESNTLIAARCQMAR